MQKTDQLIRTKLRMPFTRRELVTRPRLQEQVAKGLCGPLTLITAPAGFGKTTLVASYIACCDMSISWLTLDKDDNQVERFLSYLTAAIQESDGTIGREAAQLLAAPQAMAAPKAAAVTHELAALQEAVLTSLINDLDSAERETALVLDDYQLINNQAVHEAVAFLIEHCPSTFHLVIATRSDPALPLTRLRARGQIIELRAADLRFTEPEAAHFLNSVMGLDLDAKSVAVLAERTEGWIAGLQMAAITIQSALSMRDREDVGGFIEGFSGTNRYILDYLVEEVLASQPPEIQHFLLYTSILERLTAPLCDAVLANDEGSKTKGDDRSTHPESLSLSRSAAILEYMERTNLFLVPLDDERIWYRYHQLFADLLHARLQQSLGLQGVSRLHLLAAGWHEMNGSILEAIQHASMASDDEMVERLIEQHYLEMMNRGEMSWVRYWMGKLSKELVYRRPWLCLYEALSHSWFGQLEEANKLLNEAEKSIRAKISDPGAQAMLGYHAYVKSRVTAMQGDTRRAIEYCRTAREIVPAENLGLHIDFSITLGYEYFLYGDFENASKTLNETIRSGYTAGAVNNPVAAYCVLARLRVYQGQLHEASDLLKKAEQLTHETSGQNLGVIGLVDVGTAALLCEWNELESALARLRRGLDYLPWWGKADDLCLTYVTLSRIQLAQGNLAVAAEAIEKANELARTCGIFSEARSVVEAAQVKIWLIQGDWTAIDRWAASREERLISGERFGFENELTHITRARVFIAQKKTREAIDILRRVEDAAQSAGRAGRLIEIMLLKALALQAAGDTTQADIALTQSLKLSMASGYMRIYLDEGKPMQKLLAQRVTLERSKEVRHADASLLRDYANYLISQFEAEPYLVKAAQEEGSLSGDLATANKLAGKINLAANNKLVEPLSQRELEVLQLLALGNTNEQIARQLFVSRGTIKAHTASIYRKLEAANRTEAVARARQLDILP